MNLNIYSKKHGNYITTIDKDDYEKVSSYKWYISKQKNNVYIKTIIDKKNIGMHEIIMNTPNGYVTDHINHNTLDNRKCNLRVCLHLENSRNRSSKLNSTSKYLGVFWRKDRCLWQSKIQINGRPIFLGLFENEIDAALVYNGAAKYLFKEFANLNEGF